MIREIAHGTDVRDNVKFGSDEAEFEGRLAIAPLCQDDGDSNCTLPDLEELRRTLADRFQLTRRELDVAIALLEGGTDRSIADQMHISPATLRTHVQHIFSKSCVNSRAEFCSQALFSQEQERWQ